MKGRAVWEHILMTWLAVLPTVCQATDVFPINFHTVTVQRTVLKAEHGIRGVRGRTPEKGWKRANIQTKQSSSRSKETKLQN